KLKYAAKDARDFAAALKAQEGGIYREVELKVLVDGEASSAAVKRALSWLDKQATSRDVGLVFLAGHGVTDPKGRYHFLTADAVSDELQDTALDSYTLVDRTRALSGKVLVFLDTCFAGKAMGTRGVVDVNPVLNE